MKRLFLSLVIFFSLFGCVGPEMILGPIINGVIAWKEGEAHKYYGYDSDVVYRASKRALIEMGFPILRDDPPNNQDFYLIGGKNNTLKITVQHADSNVSKLSVRIDFMGNKPYAELFYKKVDEQIHIIKFQDGKPVAVNQAS